VIGTAQGIETRIKFAVAKGIDHGMVPPGGTLTMLLSNPFREKVHPESIKSGCLVYSIGSIWIPGS
jgi:hypothetical protein